MRNHFLRAIPALLALGLGASASAWAWDDGAIDSQGIGHAPSTAGHSSRPDMQNPQDNAALRHVKLAHAGSIVPGGRAPLNFNIAVPAALDARDFHWAMARDNFKWFHAGMPSFAVWEGGHDAPADSSASQAASQAQRNYSTCVNSLTGVTAVALTCLGVALSHNPGGGVAGLLVGAGVGHFLVGPIACAPNLNP